MPALQANSQLLIASLVRYANSRGDSVAAKACLIGVQNTARTAWLQGDEYASAISADGSNTTWLREIPANILDQLCESALQIIEAQLAAGTTELPNGAVRYGSFEHAFSILG